MKLAQFCRSFGLQNALGFCSYSAQAASETSTHSLSALYRRLSRIGDPNASILPVLDQWIEEGQTIEKKHIFVFIREFRYYRRFRHALEMSMWMSDKMCFSLSSRDVSIRLALIANVHGIEEAENYFSQIPQQLKSLHTHSALLNCYANAKSMEKAEALFQKMCDMGLARATVSYNSLLNLYYQTENYKKLETLIHEMEAKGICFDRFSFGILLSAYAASSDVEGIDKVIMRMESNPNVIPEWSDYTVAACSYKKAGHLDRAFEMLKKSEGLIPNSRKRGIAFEHLITLYATLGKKDEVERLWECYKKTTKVYNRGYISIITSILKFDDIEQAEKIFEKWESSNLNFDIRIPNFLIRAYCINGLLEKAETLKNKLEFKGEKPDEKTWYYLATGHILNNQPRKAIEAMKQAISVCRLMWRVDEGLLVAILEYMKQKDDVVGAEEFLGLLRGKDIIPVDFHERLLLHIRDGNSSLQELKQWRGDVLAENNKTLQHLEIEDVNT